MARIKIHSDINKKNELYLKLLKDFLLFHKVYKEFCSYAGSWSVFSERMRDLPYVYWDHHALSNVGITKVGKWSPKYRSLVLSGALGGVITYSTWRNNRHGRSYNSAIRRVCADEDDLYAVIFSKTKKSLKRNIEHFIRKNPKADRAILRRYQKREEIKMSKRRLKI